MTTPNELQMTPTEIAFILALRALRDSWQDGVPNAPQIKSAAYWLELFPDAFNKGDKDATGGKEDYRQWPKREDRIYFAGYPIAACAQVWKLSGNTTWLDEAYTMAAQGFTTIQGIQNHVSLNEMLFLRGVSFLIDVLPAGNPRRAELIQGRGEVWAYHWQLGNVKRDITHILTDSLLIAYSIVATDPAHADQAQDCIRFAEAGLKKSYDAAINGIWQQSISDDPRYQGAPDAGHACRDVGMVARAIQFGYGEWGTYSSLMAQAFWKVYNPTTRRFSWALDGTGTPPAHNFGYLWAAVGSLDINAQKAFETYCEPYQGRQSDPYLALYYAEMAWGAAQWGA